LKLLFRIQDIMLAPKSAVEYRGYPYPLPNILKVCVMIDIPLWRGLLPYWLPFI